MIQRNTTKTYALAGLAMVGLCATGCSTIDSRSTADAVNTTGFEASLAYNDAASQPFESAHAQHEGLVALVGLFAAHQGEIDAPDGINMLTTGNDVYLQQPGSSLMLRVDHRHANAITSTNATASANDAGFVTTDASSDSDVFFAIGDVYSLGLE